MKYIITIAAMLLCFSSVTAQAANNISDQKSAIHTMESDTLTRLYHEKPDTEREIKNAAGYAVFSSGELALVWVSGGFGHGIAHNNKDSKDTYMKMAKAGVGIGLGAKDYNTVFVFNDQKAYQNFVTTGLDLSGTADMAAKANTSGGAASGAADVLAGVQIYQLTDSGLLAQAMLQGTKYWRDETLNTAKVSEAQ